MHHNLFKISHIDEHLTITNNTAKHLRIFIFAYICPICSLGKFLEVDLLGQSIFALKMMTDIISLSSR